MIHSTADDPVGPQPPGGPTAHVTAAAYGERLLQKLLVAYAGVMVLMALLLAMLAPTTRYADATTPQGRFVVSNESQFAPLYTLLAAQGLDAGLAMLLVGSSGYAVAALLYWYILQRLQSAPSVLWKLVRSPLHWAVLVGVWLLLLAAYPLLSNDTTYYVAQARLAAHYNANPYLSSSQALLLTDPWFQWLSPIHVTSPAYTYGPVWLALSLPAVLISGSSLVLALLGIKATAAGLLALCAIAIWCLLPHESIHTRRLAVLALLWHPFLVLEVVWNGHNDVALVLGLLLAVLTYKNGFVLPAFWLLMMSVATKYVSVICLPLFLAHALRSRPTTRARLHLLTLISAVCASTIAVLFGPLVWSQWSQIFVGLANQSALINPSFGAFVEVWSTPFLGPSVARLILPGILGVVTVWLCWQIWNGEDLVDAIILLMLVYVLVCSTWFMPWYGMWFAGLAIITRPNRAIVVLGAVLILPIYYLVNALPFSDIVRVLMFAALPLWLIVSRWNKDVLVSERSRVGRNGG